jgi:tetratricopeptide (TPR) repeat protein
MKHVARWSIAILGAVVFMAACEEPADADPDPEIPTERTEEAHEVDLDELGAVSFQVSCSEAVRRDFDRAVALVHHMMYSEARGVFEELTEADPQCAMAHWGVAKTLYQPMWPSRPGISERERGWEHVQTARDLGPGSEREAALLEATAAFFQDPEVDEYWPRIERWANAMEEAYQAHPDDPDVAAFHGLAVMALGQTTDDPVGHNARTAEILSRVLEDEPLHPGAIHYTIHADDVTGRASENLEVVDRYSEIAPHTPHALHMPSHIHVRLGNWPEVIEWNRASAEAALLHPVGDAVSFHHIHALDYKLYGYLQRGDDARAQRVLDDALSTEPYQEDFNSAFHLAIMPARYAVERRAWEEAAELQPREPDYLEWDRYHWPEALSWYARGLGAAHTGDIEEARAAESRMIELRDAASGAGEDAFATYIEVDRLILSGRIAHLQGDSDQAVSLTREAAELEQTVEKHPITPGALLPPYEALGDLLAELDRPADALDAYEAGLEVWPKRYHSLVGAARAARESGETERSGELYATLLEVIDESAAEREGVAEARERVNES